MDLKSTMNDSWKICSIATLLGWLFLFMFFGKNHPSINLSNFINAIAHKKPSNFTYNFVQQPTQKSKTTCNIFDGRWVYRPDDNLTYNALNCPFIEEKMSCQKNARPDFEYLKWRWEAINCEIPLFNAIDMMEMLRNKRMILAGDSLNRNMWESLACLLHSSVPSSSVELHDNSTISRLFWKSKEYNFTVEFYWSPFLVEFNTNHQSGKRVLVLDKLSPNSKMWKGADVMVFNSGYWWVQPGDYRRWDLFEYEGKLIDDMPVELAYERGMRTWATWIENNVDPDIATVFFRSISAEHKTKTSERWCYNKTKLVVDDSYASDYPNYLVEIIESLINGFSKSQVKYLNITKLSKYRIEAHPSIYRYKDWKILTQKNEDILSLHPDCSHWCLPGVPDTWNRLLYASLLFDIKRDA